jgi:hypothetical protein
MFILKYSPNRYIGEQRAEDLHWEQDGDPIETSDFFAAKRFDTVGEALDWIAKDQINFNLEQVTVHELEIKIHWLSPEEVAGHLQASALKKLSNAERKVLGL